MKSLASHLLDLKLKYQSEAGLPGYNTHDTVKLIEAFEKLIQMDDAVIDSKLGIEGQTMKARRNVTLAQIMEGGV